MSDPFDPEDEDAEEEDSERYYGMERIGIEPPEASIPDATTEFENADADPEVQTLFWKVVVALKFALLTLTVGAMLVLTGENPTLGRRVLVLAAVLAAYTAYQYRTSKHRLDSGEFDSTDDEEPDGDESQADGPPDGEESQADGPPDGDGVDAAASGSGGTDGVAANGSGESPRETGVKGS